MKVAAIQMVSEISVDHNLAQAAPPARPGRRRGRRARRAARVLRFMGRNDRDKLLLAETPGLGTVQDFLSDTARELGIWIVGGTLPMATDDRARGQRLHGLQPEGQGGGTLRQDPPVPLRQRPQSATTRPPRWPPASSRPHSRC